MVDTPPFAIRFKRTEPARAQLYQDALELAARIYTVIELASNERYFLRDQLDRKSAQVPQLIAQALATGDMAARRALLLRARLLVTDCASILDIVAERGTVEAEALTPARAAAELMVAALAANSVPPSRIW